MGKSTKKMKDRKKVKLLFKQGTDVDGDRVLLVYQMTGNGALATAGSLRISKDAEFYLERLCKGRKPRKLTLEYDDDQSFRPSVKT